MTQEEKAKAYDEAIEKLRDFYRDYDTVSRLIDVKEELANLFPELCESEDERISKKIKKVLNWYRKSFSEKSLRNEEYDEMFAWLEKQGNIDKASYEIAEKEKREFVGDGFIKCYADFQDFKEGETYWLEYVGNDNYNVRSDNLLSKTYHITPCQLYTIFKKMTWLEKQDNKESKIMTTKDITIREANMLISAIEYAIDMLPNHEDLYRQYSREELREFQQKLKEHIKNMIITQRRNR